jgi:phosphatidylglycerophosphatase A
MSPSAFSFDDLVDFFSPRNSHWRTGWRRFLVVFGVTGAFVGYLPLAPGTWGTIVGVGLVYWLRSLPTTLFVSLCVALTLLGVWLCAVAQHIFKKHDPQRAVVDEIVGVMITMIGMPVTPYWMLVGFLVFRFLDILKPVPANLADTRLKTGWGVMLDDVIAGVYGNIILQLMWRAQI